MSAKNDVARIYFYIGKVNFLLLEVGKMEADTEEEIDDKLTLENHLKLISQSLHIVSEQDLKQINADELENIFKNIDELEEIILKIGEENE